jgi:hypothetical protein
MQRLPFGYPTDEGGYGLPRNLCFAKRASDRHGKGPNCPDGAARCGDCGRSRERRRAGRIGHVRGVRRTRWWVGPVIRRASSHP